MIKKGKSNELDPFTQDGRFLLNRKLQYESILFMQFKPDFLDDSSSGNTDATKIYLTSSESSDLFLSFFTSYRPHNSASYGRKMASKIRKLTLQIMDVQ